MPCEDNVIKGSQLVLLARTEDDTAWQLIGGVTEFSYTSEATPIDSTSSSTVGDYAEAQTSGFKNFTGNITGNSDTRTGQIDPSTGLEIVGSYRLQEIHDKSNSKGRLRVLNVFTGGFYDGCFIVNSYSSTGPVQGLLSFTSAIQSSDGVSKVGEV